MTHNWYHKLPQKYQIEIDKIWGKLPFCLKYGFAYTKNSSLLKKSQWWSREELESYQFTQLKKLCIYSYRFVPYYRRIFDQCGFNPYYMSNIQDIEVLPFLDKELIEANFDQLISSKIPRRKWRTQTTGGTSGKQLRFLMEKRTGPSREYPFVNSIWGRVGYQRGRSRVGVLRNQILSPGKLWEYDYKTKTYIFDSYHLTDENIPRILDKITTLNLEYLHTYPSSVLILCEYIKKTELNFSSSLKAILATSENLYPGQQSFIEESMKCRLFTFYGHSECACIAGWCEESDFYHVNTEYGYCELIDESGAVISESDTLGEIVCTGFGNYLMPLIRYKTGDYSSWSPQTYCSCGRHYPLLNQVEGRWTQEMFVGQNGNKISMTALNMHSDIFKNVENYQFEQNRVGECVLRIVKNPHYNFKDEQCILNELGNKFDGSLKITIEYVPEIKRTLRGKQRFIIQSLL